MEQKKQQAVHASAKDSFVDPCGSIHAQICMGFVRRDFMPGAKRHHPNALALLAI
ncbi:MAG: hypothetical protein QNJ04_14880 [Desulfobacterales bacterium]|nr:hypothetical protein [Desulfobacterales bacterium]